MSRRRSTGSGASSRAWYDRIDKTLDQEKAEFEARLATLRDQQAKAREGKRQEIEARMAELKSSHEAAQGEARGGSPAREGVARGDA